MSKASLLSEVKLSLTEAVKELIVLTLPISVINSGGEFAIILTPNLNSLTPPLLSVTFIVIGWEVGEKVPSVLKVGSGGVILINFAFVSDIFSISNWPAV